MHRRWTHSNRAIGSEIHAVSKQALNHMIHLFQLGCKHLQCVPHVSSSIIIIIIIYHSFTCCKRRIRFSLLAIFAFNVSVSLCRFSIVLFGMMIRCSSLSPSNGCCCWLLSLSKSSFNNWRFSSRKFSSCSWRTCCSIDAGFDLSSNKRPVKTDDLASASCARVDDNSCWCSLSSASSSAKRWVNGKSLLSDVDALASSTLDITYKHQWAPCHAFILFLYHIPSADAPADHDVSPTSSYPWIMIPSPTYLVSWLVQIQQVWPWAPPTRSMQVKSLLIYTDLYLPSLIAPLHVHSFPRVPAQVSQRVIQLLAWQLFQWITCTQSPVGCCTCQCSLILCTLS